MTDSKTESEAYHRFVLRQIELGILVCPVTKRRLKFKSAEWLTTDDERITYRLLYGKVPVLITDMRLVEEYAKSSSRMNAEYTTEHLKRQSTWFYRLRSNDYRTKESERALDLIFQDLETDAVCLSVGGGPARANIKLLNLNIGPFPNVDIVGDAHNLPYADNSVDALYCEAVFEHLHTPALAAGEIFRVLKKGAKAYICTPFLQAYHGYPHHYQNYTISGHSKLFEDAGLTVTNSGTCVGPTYTLRNMVATYIANYAPVPLRQLFRIIWEGISICIAPLDILIRNKPNAHVMASTTFLVAEKN
jgi:SAM-dependent methyltransferase